MSSGNLLRTLVVEDEEDVRLALIEALNESARFQVVAQAAGVDSAYEAFRSTPPDVLFLDIKLAGGDAFQLLRRLKREGHALPPVVINTGFREFDLAQRALNEFGDCVIHLLQKPFWNNWPEKEALILSKITQFHQRQKQVLKDRIGIASGRQLTFYKVSDVVCIRTGEKGRGQVEIVLENGRDTANVTLKSLLPELPATFRQINRFTVVNLAWVSAVDLSNGEVCLRNGERYLAGEGYREGLGGWVGG